MTNKTDRAIRAAIRECLVACLDSEMPLSALAHCLNDLRQKQWPLDCIHTVEMTVVKILARLVDGDTDLIDNPPQRSQQDR